MFLEVCILVLGEKNNLVKVFFITLDQLFCREAFPRPKRPEKRECFVEL